MLPCTSFPKSNFSTSIPFSLFHTAAWIQLKSGLQTTTRKQSKLLHTPKFAILFGSGRVTTDTQWAIMSRRMNSVIVLDFLMYIKHQGRIVTLRPAPGTKWDKIGTPAILHAKSHYEANLTICPKCTKKHD